MARPLHWGCYAAGTCIELDYALTDQPSTVGVHGRCYVAIAIILDD